MSKYLDAVTHERLLQVVRYEPGTGNFYRKTPSGEKLAGSVNSGGYGQVVVDKVGYKSHRLAWFYAYKIWPTNIIDHINGDKLDNRLCNLREAPAAMNQQNRRRASKNSKTGMLGVRFRFNKYEANIAVGSGRVKYLGQFQTAEDAHNAYLQAKRQDHLGCTL
jgi:hypothetical protein